MAAETAIAVAAAGTAVLALLAMLWLVRRAQRHQQTLDAELERGKAEFDVAVAHEVELRATELAQVLARARADSLSALAQEERRIAEERRRDVAEREREAGARLGVQLTEAQAGVEQRVANWTTDVERLQQGLADDLTRVGARQRQLMSEIHVRLGRDAEGLQTQIEEQRAQVARLREELESAAQAVLQSASSELEQHAHERRQALHEISERLRAREADLRELVAREGSDAAAALKAALADVERRQVEQLQRVVSRTAARFSEAAGQEFETAIRSAREDAARRLGRELDLAVERFAREADGVLAERVNQVSDSAAQRVEQRLSQLGTALERQRDDVLGSLEQRAHEVETGLRERLRAIASDAEAERGVLEERLRDLARRVDELTTRA